MRNDYDCYLFDLDGTLADTAPGIAAALNAALAAEHVTAIDDERIRDWIGGGAKKLVVQALTQAQQPTDEATTSRVLTAYLHAYAAAPLHATRLYPSVRETLTTLRQTGRQLGVVTNKPSVITRAVLDGLGIANHFTVVLGSDDVAKPKPAPDGVNQAMQALNVNPTRCVLVGDSENDVRAARAASIGVIAVNYGYNHGQPIEDSAPDRIITCLADLLGD